MAEDKEEKKKSERKNSKKSQKESKEQKKKKSSKKSGEAKKTSKKKQGDEKQPTQELKKHDKQLRNFFIVLGFVALVMVGFYMFYNYSPEFEYKGVEFKTVEQGEIIAYKTLVPLYRSPEKVDTNYKFFIRNHPEDIKDIPVPEELELKNIVIFNYSNEILCGGDGNIAMANLKQLYKVMGAKTGESSNVNKTYRKCDEQGRYNYINIKRGERTKIEKIGPACYEMTFRDCEILEVTERYMLKMFVQEQDTKFPVSNIQG